MRSSPGSSGKEKARAALALLDRDASEAEFLLGHVLEADTDRRVVADPQASGPPPLEGGGRELWPEVNDPKAARASGSGMPPSSPWRGRTRDGSRRRGIVADILSVNALQLGDWTDAFRAVGASSSTPSVQKFKEGEQDERKVAATILNDYANDDIPVLLDLLKEADPAQFPILFAKATAHREEAVESMRKRSPSSCLKDADPRQFPILFPRARGPAAASKSMKEELGKKPPPGHLQADGRAGGPAGQCPDHARPARPDRPALAGPATGPSTPASAPT